MKIQNICPYCVKRTELEQIVGNEIVKVRGQNISVPSKYFHCLECNQDFDDPKSDDDILELAYREYRRMNNMLQPEELKSFRKSCNLTQKELSELLSWGEVTITRYEKGKLQENGHDTLLRLIQNPINMLELIRKKKDAIPPEKREALVEKLISMVRTESNFVKNNQEIFGCYSENIFSGCQKLQIEKVIVMIRFFCYPEGQFKTKLNKLIFYSDYAHFAKYQASITGLRYSKLPYGPVPDYYERYLGYLIENGMLEIEERIMGEILQSREGPELTCFSESEKRILMKVKEIFANYSCKQISDISHQEEGYINTKDKCFISYKYATKLNIVELLED